MSARPQAHERSSLIPRAERHGWPVVASALFHSLLFAGLAVGTFSSSCQGSTPPPQTPIAAKLVRLGKPRPEHHLPRIPTAPPAPPTAREAPAVTTGAPNPPPTPPPPTPTPTPPPASSTPTPQQTRPKEPSAAPAPQAEAPRTARSSDRLDEIMRQFAAGARTGPAEELPGRLDGDPMGDAERAEEGERYLALLEQRLRSHYVVPSAIPDAERIRLTAIVTIRVERDGRISRFRITEPSGNGLFDSALEAAVQRASPLPPPPDHLLELLRDYPIRFRI